MSPKKDIKDSEPVAPKAPEAPLIFTDDERLSHCNMISSGMTMALANEKIKLERAKNSGDEKKIEECLASHKTAEEADKKIQQERKAEAKAAKIEAAKKLLADLDK